MGYRQQVLKLFQRVTEEFVKHVGTLKGLSPSVIENAGGAVHTFGSYRLGVYGPGQCRNQSRTARAVLQRIGHLADIDRTHQALILIRLLLHPSMFHGTTSLNTSLRFSERLGQKTPSLSSR